MLGNFVLSSGYYEAYYVKAQKTRHMIKDQYDKIFADADLILSPIAPSTAISVNLAGLPSKSTYIKV